MKPVELSSVAPASIEPPPERSPQAQFVEDVGVMFEAVGLPRMAGRILGWLLVSVPAQQSLSEIAEVLQASKGSISMMTRLLIQVGLIERISLPGDRRDYFQIKPHAWTQMSQQRMTQITAFRELADRGLALLADQGPHQQMRLQEMRDIHAFWERELPLLHDRWLREQTSDSQ
ncbi:MarR family transcriptional regulator [Microcoleus sp. FACHB-1515]|uniref:GbsR/MarR family transcriptional regulator n=1 Tax=Cyanophyceae TaxID=3028117 RepID=UPI0028C3FE88|nr:MarR family transcriptional regulator [Microcoleus sp. FACHB-1515]